MDEGSWNGTAGEVKDSSGRGNHGNAVNGTAFSPGRYGYGANTAGTEVINIPGFDELNGSSEMTISYWYYAGVSSGGPVTNWAGGTQFIVYHTTNRRINVFVSRNVGDVSTYALSEDYIVELNKWTNVQIVYDGTESTNENKLRVYVDGVEKAFVSFNNNIPSNLTTVSGQLIFGDVNTSSRYNHFDGLVDEVRIYNRILNSSELRALYNYEPEPVVFLKLDETTGSIAVDHTGNGNNGTLVNSPLWATGKYINAIVLDGIDDYIVMGNSSYTNITSNISYGGWFKTAGASDYAGLISKYNSSRNGYASGIRPSGEVFCNINLNWGAGQIGSVYSGSSLEDNLWHHHMCVYNGSVFKLYVDGILVNSSNYTDGIGNNIGQDLYLGRDSGYMSGRNFNGYIDEIKIYNYAVTQEQVVKDMNYF